MTSFRPIRARLTAVLSSVAFVAVTATTSVVVPPAAQAATPPTPVGLPSAIEGMGSYVPQRACQAGARPGTAKLAAMLRATYPGRGTGTWRNCLASSSEHHDGRAIDWMTSVRVRKQRAMATSMLTWLLATDAAGNRYANARRLGVMYIIWNNKIWGAYNPERGWRPYNNCAKHPKKSWDSTCHRNHVHISLTWEGAMGRTSYWTRQVAWPDYGPCRPRDLNWAAPRATPNPTPCPQYAKVRAPKGASATRRTLTAYSGQFYRPGYRSTGVKAVQRVLKVTPRSGFYGPKTTRAMKKWQKKRGLYVTGTANHQTWRALLRAQR